MKKNNLNIKDNLKTDEIQNTDRRKFLGHLTKAGVIAAAAGAIGVKPFLGGKESVALAGGGQPRRNSAKIVRDNATNFCFQDTQAKLYRANNGDEELYPKQESGIFQKECRISQTAKSFRRRITLC